MMPISQVAAFLRPRIVELAEHFRGQRNKKMSGRSEVRWGSKGSFAVFLAGKNAGRWRDFETGEGGDALDLIRVELNLPSEREAADWARAEYGLEGHSDGHTRHDPIPELPPFPEPDHDPGVDKRALAMALLDECKPIDGAPAALYLRNRGLTVPLPPTLLYHPSLKHPSGHRGPALVGMIQNADDDATGIWRIWVTEDGRKAAVTPNKMGLGIAAGGSVRLGPVGPEIHVAEGIESALAASELMFGVVPVWAALSTSGMIGLKVPPMVRRVVFWPDHDKPTTDKATGLPKLNPDGSKRRPGMDAVRRAIDNLQANGVEAAIYPRHFPGDPLDFLLERKRRIA